MSRLLDDPALIRNHRSAPEKLMRARTALILIGVAAMSAALAADAFVMRPGRWEMTMAMDFGANKPPPGLPLSKPTTLVSCVTPEEAREFSTKGFLPPPDEGCTVREYKATKTEITYVVKCDDVAMDFRATMHSPDSFTGISTSHGKDPSEKLVMKFSGRRTGNQCSAQELAADSED